MIIIIFFIDLRREAPGAIIDQSDGYNDKYPSSLEGRRAGSPAGFEPGYHMWQSNALTTRKCIELAYKMLRQNLCTIGMVRVVFEINPNVVGRPQACDKSILVHRREICSERCPHLHAERQLEVTAFRARAPNSTTVRCSTPHHHHPTCTNLLHRSYPVVYPL